MNRKTIIQIAVIVICLGVAAFVIYNGVLKDKSSGTSAVPIIGKDVKPINPLPYGADLSGVLKQVLKKNNLQHGNYNYPKLTSEEVGVPVGDLIKPIPAPAPVN